MKLSDGTTLMHDGVPYDPVKAHEYYLRTRHLKGRRPGRAVPVRGHVRNISRSSKYTVRVNGKIHNLTGQQLQEQQAYASMRVDKIKNRLVELATELKKMVEKAKKAQTPTHQKPTAAQKQKAKQKAKQHRQAHKQLLANKAKVAKANQPKKPATSKDPVAELQSKITEIKGRLQTAINTQRALFSAQKVG